ncbi:hypothetical protein [Neisseria wadsworthii]|uniref:hypothetical protein n=1 Tax=Neisseria wadsworthii TaxID=607711 RepID=UPI00131CB400|nr:hypothetical protein [Neisseria wadsworthii]
MRLVNFILRLNLFLFLFCLILDFLIIFVIDYPSMGVYFDFLEAFQSGRYAELVNKSVFVTVIFSTINLFLNFIASLILIYFYFQGKKRRIFNFIQSKNKFIFEFGSWSINPYVIEEKMIVDRSIFFRFIQLLFYSWGIFIFIYLFFDFQFLQLPKWSVLIHSISNYKFYLFLFNFFLFFIISFMWLGFVVVWLLTLKSFFVNKKEI